MHTVAEHEQARPEASLRTRSYLGDVLGGVALACGILAGVMLCVWAYSETCFLTANLTDCHPLQTVWTPLAWFATLAAFAACSIVGCLVPGLIQSVRPALLGPRWSAPADRLWHRLAGIARMWMALVIAIPSAFLALHPPDLFAQHPWLNGWAFVAVFTVIFGPLYAVWLIKALVQHGRHPAG